MGIISVAKKNDAKAKRYYEQALDASRKKIECVRDINCF
jgi:hypothetical protein